ncbi:MAG: ABC transporter permease [Rikenellaceae bacterium]|nr:ABC transporter permease [Rikenellaceae bacterium]
MSRLSILFARRYLFSAKSHSVINVISAVSVVAVGVPVAAMIILMSVFNGFAGLVDGMQSAFDADLEVQPREGKTFVVSSLPTDSIGSIEGVRAWSAALEQSALAEYNGRQVVVTVRGVDEHVGEVLPIEEHISSGAFELRLGEIEQACVGSSVAYRLGVRTFLDTPLNLYSPRRGEISTLLPIDAYTHRRTWPSGTFSISGDVDDAYILTTIELAQSLFDYDGRASSLMIDVEDGRSIERTREAVQTVVGEAFRVVTRLEQQAALYRIMKYEKWGIFFISLLVLIIASFSIVGSLAMLIIDKRDNIATLRAVGARTEFVRSIFAGEGALIGALGAVIGLVLGVGICLAQQHLGLIEMPGTTFVVQYYPVEMKLTDILLIMVAMATVTMAITQLTVRTMIRPTDTQNERKV